MKATAKKPTAEQRAEQASARERLERLKASKGNTIHRVVIDGEDWFIREMNYRDLLQIGMLAGSKKGSAPDSLMERITVEALTKCVCVSKEDDTPYFSKSDLELFMGEPAASLLLMELMNAVVSINPGIMPKN